MDDEDHNAGSADTQESTEGRYNRTHNKKIKLDAEIANLKPVVFRTYASREHLNPKTLRKFIDFLKSHDKLESVFAIAEKVHIAPKTVQEWFDNIKKDPTWSPLLANRQPTVKTMTDLLESAILWHIYRKFLKPGLQINDKMCKVIALAFWNKFPSQRLRNTFRASSSWVRRFKQKYNLVNRRAHFKKRSPVSPKTKEMSQRFLRTVAEIYQKHKQEGTLRYMINIDETCWRYCNLGGLTWASKGSEHIECLTNTDDKKGITAIAAITAEEKQFKLPLCLIKKGKTDRAANVLSSICEYFQIEHSDNGWNTIECFAIYLKWLREELNERYKDFEGYTPDTKIDIILDLYASHRAAPIIKYAEKLNFNLHFIPPSFTDVFQPLDRYIFGSLKSMARSRFYESYIKHPERKVSIIDACNILLDTWASISEDTQKKAWLPYSDPKDGDLDDFIHRSSIEFTPEESVLTLSSDDDQEEAPEPAIDTDISSESDDEYNNSIDVFDSEDIEIDNIKEEIKSVINHEDSIMFKPIENENGTCSTNVLVQIFNMIPGIKNEIEQLSVVRNGNVSDGVCAINLCLNQYEEEENVNCFPVLYCAAIPNDVNEGLESIMRQLSTQYGITMLEERHITINQSDYSMKLSDVLDETIAGREFLIYKTLLFKKDRGKQYRYPEIFIYKSYILVLKALIISEENPKPLGHFRVYIRNKFSNDFLMISDTTIKKADIEDTYREPICSALYYVFNNEDKFPNETLAQTPAETIKEMEIDEELKQILKMSHPNCSFKANIITRTNKKQFPRNREEIIPRTRLSISYDIKDMTKELWEEAEKNKPKEKKPKGVVKCLRKSLVDLHKD